MITDSKGISYIIDPFRTPIKLTGEWRQTDKCTIGNINAIIYQRTRKVPVVFGGEIITIQQKAVSYTPINSQWPVMYIIRRDWNKSYMEEYL